MDSHHKKGQLRFKIRIGLALKVEKNLAGKNFFIWFLAKLDNSKSFGKSFFLAFIAFKGLKRPKKAKKKLLPNDVELSNLARNQIKKISPAKFFSTFVTLVSHGLWPWWPFFEKNLGFEVQESLY